MSKDINWFQDSFWFGETFLRSLRGSVFDPIWSVFALVFHYLGETFFFYGSSFHRLCLCGS